MSGATKQADGNNTYNALYEEEVLGALWPEKVNTRGPRAVTWCHVHVAELKETAQAPPPYQQDIILYLYYIKIKYL